MTYSRFGSITKNEYEKDVATFLESKPYISEIVTHFGKYSFFGKVASRDLNKLSEIIDSKI